MGKLRLAAEDAAEKDFVRLAVNVSNETAGTFRDLVNRKRLSHEHDGGRISLSISSECDWKIKVVDIPG